MKAHVAATEYLFTLPLYLFTTHHHRVPCSTGQKGFLTAHEFKAALLQLPAMKGGVIGEEELIEMMTEVRPRAHAGTARQLLVAAPHRTCARTGEANGRQRLGRKDGRCAS